MSRHFTFLFGLRAALVVTSLLVWGLAYPQTCVAPGKDGPATLSGILNTYYPGVAAGIAAGATSLTLGLPSLGAAGTVTVGDKLLIIQMQGADINSNDDERYGDGTGTAGNTPFANQLLRAKHWRAAQTYLSSHTRTAVLQRNYQFGIASCSANVGWCCRWSCGS
jgi:hypothetical protein